MTFRFQSSPCLATGCDHQVDIGRGEVSPKNDAEVANTIKTLIEGLSQWIESGLLSVDAAAEFLREFVPSMLPWADENADDDERRRVARTMLLLRRIQDGQGLEGLAPAGAGAPGNGQGGGR